MTQEERRQSMVRLKCHKTKAIMHTRKSKRKGPVQRFKMGRVCKKFGCKQRLSIYNSELYCHVHTKEFLS